MKNYIKDFRSANKISQAGLATLTGVTRQTINAIENNKYDPSLKLAFDLANILHTSVDELFVNNVEE